jgi:hypothetical protein
MAEICLARAGTSAAHCWHRTGVAYMSNPPQYEERCCHCGEVRCMTVWTASTGGHGPYAPGPFAALRGEEVSDG